MTPSLPPGYKLDAASSMPPRASVADVGVSPPAGYKLDSAPAISGDQPSAIARAASSFWDGIGGPAVVNVVRALGGDQGAADQTMKSVKSTIEGLAGEPARVWSEMSDTGKAMVAGHIGDAAYHLAGSVPLIGSGAQRVGMEADQGKYADAVGHAAALILPFALGGAGNAGAAAGAVADTAGTVADVAKAGAAGVKAAAPGVAKGAGMAVAGEGLAHMGGGWLPRIMLTYPGFRAAFRGVKAGVEAARDTYAEGSDLTGKNVDYAGETAPAPTTKPGPAPVYANGPASTPLPPQPAAASSPAAAPAGPVPLNRPLAASGTAGTPTPPAPAAPPPPGRIALGYSAPQGTPSAAEQLGAEMRAPPGADMQLLDDIAKGMGGTSFAKLTPQRQAAVRNIAARMDPTPAPPSGVSRTIDPSGAPRAPATPAAPENAPPASQTPAAAPAEGPKVISIKNLKQEAADSGRPMGEVIQQYRQDGWRIEYDPFYDTLRNRRGKLVAQ
jgi:hypothetical protein